VLPNDEKWYGVTYREDKEMVQRAFAEMTERGVYPAVGLTHVFVLERSGWHLHNFRLFLMWWDGERGEL
jgi:hypothetical protein